MYICIYTHTYIYIHTCVCVCMCVNTYVQKLVIYYISIHNNVYIVYIVMFIQYIRSENLHVSHVSYMWVTSLTCESCLLHGSHVSYVSMKYDYSLNYHYVSLNYSSTNILVPFFFFKSSWVISSGSSDIHVCMSVYLRCISIY